jgi:hypothetical protein
MSDDLPVMPKGPISTADVISIARETIAKEASKEKARRNANDAPIDPQQRPGVTLDLCHKRLAALPDEIIDIIKDEVERLAISHNEVSSFSARLPECSRLRYLNARFNRFTGFPTIVCLLIPSKLSASNLISSFE